MQANKCRAQTAAPAEPKRGKDYRNVIKSLINLMKNEVVNRREKMKRGNQNDRTAEK